MKNSLHRRGVLVVGANWSQADLHDLRQPGLEYGYLLPIKVSKCRHTSWDSSSFRCPPLYSIHGSCSRTFSCQLNSFYLIIRNVLVFKERLFWPVWAYENDISGAAFDMTPGKDDGHPGWDSIKDTAWDDTQSRQRDRGIKVDWGWCGRDGRGMLT